MNLSRCAATFVRLVLLMAFSAAAHSQTSSFPERPIRIVVPFSPGGGTDMVARIIAEQMASQFAQPVIVDNRPGAATVIGMSLVAKAYPDGYTLVFSGAGSYSVLPAVRKLPFDMQKDLTPLALVGRMPLVIAVPASSAYRSLADLAAATRSRTEAITYYTFGPGSSPHLVGALFAREARLRATPVPYKGSTDAIVALLRGDVDVGVETIAGLLPHVRTGRVRALAVTGERRSPFMPDVPTVAEAGFPGTTWDGYLAMAAPAGVSPAIQAKLSQSLLAILQQPEVRKAIERLSVEPVAIGPDVFARQMSREITMFRNLARSLDLELE